MSDKTFTFHEAAAELAKSLNQKVQEHQVKLEELRAKELRKSAGGKLTKNELCALCGNAPTACGCSLSKAVGGHCTSCGAALTGPLAADKTVCGACKARAPKSTKPTEKNEIMGYGNQPGQSTMGPNVAGGASMGLSEKMGKAELCKSCGKTHMGKCDMADVKPGKALEKKSPPGKFNDLPEKLKAKGMPASEAFGIAWKQKNKADAKKAEVPMNGAVADKAKKGTKLPGQKSPVKIERKGSGGEIKKSAFSDALHTAAGAKPAGAAPAVVGVPGKQPVGQGGGDAHKVPQTAPPTSVGQANKEIGGMKSIAGGGMPSVGAVGKLPMLPGRGPRAGNVQAPIAGSFVARKDEIPAQAAAGAADLAADKKAGGVGWLNALHAHVNRPKATKVAPDVMAVRDKMNMDKPVATPPAPAGAGPVRAQPSTYAGTKGAAALARGEKNPEKKMEMPAPTQGLNSANHNRRMLSIKR